MRTSFYLSLWLATLILWMPVNTRAASAAAGLWVGEITLTKVNETVVGFDAANQLVAPDPAVTTQVGSPAHLRAIFHVDSLGQVRLLKGVAVLATSNQPPEVLITEPSLYPNFAALSKVGRRVAAAGFDFGDYSAVDALSQVASNAAYAAAHNLNPTNEALKAVSSAVTNHPGASIGYLPFVNSSTFQSSANIAAKAAKAAAVQASGASTTQVQNQANAAALKALTDSQIFAAADGVVANEVKMTGSFAAGQALTGSIYLGASHPNNPFRHRRHPDHTLGYPITRAVTVQFDAGTSTNALLTVGFGADRITGTYREEIQGLHKPLGPNQNIGLITDGFIVLDRISAKGTLNQ